MAASEDVARLILEAESRGFADAAKQVTLMEGSLAALTASYKAGQVTTDDYIREGQQLRNRIDELKGGLDVATAAMKKHGNATAAAAALAERSSKSHRQLMQSITAGSYAFQDFASTSGDVYAKLNSITNNLPMILAGFGGIGTAVSIAAVALISLARNWDTIVGAFQSRNPFPKLTGDVSGLKAELHAAKEEMEKLAAQTGGTATEIQRYADLRQKIAQTEAMITAEEQKQADLKKLKDLKTQDVEDEETERKKLYKNLGGQQEDLVKAMVATDTRGTEQIDAVGAAWDRAKAKLDAYRAEDPDDIAGRDDKLVDELNRIHNEQQRLIAAQESNAREAVTGAMVRGDAEGQRKLEKAEADHPELFTNEQRVVIREASGERARQRREDKVFQERQAGQGKLDEDLAKAAEAGRGKAAKAQVDRAQDKLDAMVKGGGLDDLVAEEYAKIQKAGGKVKGADGKERTLSGEDTFVYIREMVEAKLTAMLGADGPIMEEVQELIGNTARSVTTKAETEADSSQERDEKGQAKGRKRLLTKAQRQEKADQKRRQKAFDDRMDAEAKALQQGGVQGAVEGMVAEFRDQGAQVDANGQLPRQLHEMIVAAVVREIAARNPRMNPFERAALAGRIVRQGEQAFNNRVTGEGFQAAYAETLQQLIRNQELMARRLGMQAQQAGRLNREARRVGEMLMPQNDTALQFGNFP